MIKGVESAHRLPFTVRSVNIVQSIQFTFSRVRSDYDSMVVILLRHLLFLYKSKSIKLETPFFLPSYQP